MKKIAAPFYSQDPDSKMYDSENSMDIPGNNGSFEKMYGTLNPYTQTLEEEGAPFDSGYANSILSPLNLTEEDIIDLSELSEVLVSKVGEDSTILSWGPRPLNFSKKISENNINLIVLSGEKRTINSDSFSQRYSDPMFYSSKKRVDGFLNTKPFSDQEQADIAIANIYSNLRPLAYSVVTSQDSVDIESSAKRAGFTVEKKILGKLSKFLLKKNDLKKTALVKNYSNDLSSIFVFRCDVAESSEEKLAGLQPYSSLSKNCGLLFKYSSPRDLSFHMAGVKFPIDIVFLDEDFSVKRVYENVQPGSLGVFSCSNAKYVLETLGGISGAAELDVGKKVFIDFSPEKNQIKKESDLLNGLGINRCLIKKTALAKTSIKSFERYSVLISGFDKLSTTEVVKTASLRVGKDNLSIFNLNDFISEKEITLNRVGSPGDDSARITLFSNLAHTSGDFIKVSFNDFVKNNFYSNLKENYFPNISDIIYSINNNNPSLLKSLYKACMSSETKVALAYTSNYDIDILRESVESALNARFEGNVSLSDLDCFAIPSNYGPEDILLASEYRYGQVPSKVISDKQIKYAGIPVPDSTKNVAKKSIEYIDRAKKLCNKLTDNINKNNAVYDRLKDKPDVIRGSSGEYSESSKRNARLSKRVLLNVKEVIKTLSSIQDVSTTEETIGSLADTAKTFSESMKNIFDLINIIDTDSFAENLAENTTKGVGAIDDLKITLDRCKNYVSRDILGIVILSE